MKLFNLEDYYYCLISICIIFSFYSFSYVFGVVDNRDQIIVQDDDDPFKIIFTNTMLLLGFISALATAVGVIAGLVLWLKKTVTKTTTEFISKQEKDLVQNKEETKEHIKNVKESLCNQVTSVNNNVNMQFNSLKNVVDNIDSKMDKTHEYNIRHDSILTEHERRINNLENRVSSKNSGPV